MIGNNYRRLQVLAPLIDAQKNHFLKELESFSLKSQQIYLVKGLASEKVKLAIIFQIYPVGTTMVVL